MKTRDWLGSAIHFFDLHYGQTHNALTDHLTWEGLSYRFFDSFCSISSIRHGISDLSLTSNGTITKCVVTHLHTACRIMPASFQANIHQKLKGKKPRHYRPLT